MYILNFILKFLICFAIPDDFWKSTLISSSRIQFCFPGICILLSILPINFFLFLKLYLQCVLFDVTDIFTFFFWGIFKS